MDAAFYGVQALELAAHLFCLTMIGLNIRDGLALRGRIRKGGSKGPLIEERDGGPLVVMQAPRLAGENGPHPTKPVMALCRCGLSQNKPFCDGSHAGTEYEPLEVTIDEARKVAWCNCKRTGMEPFCDGAHARLEG